METNEVETLRPWVGRSQTTIDVMRAPRFEKLRDTLGTEASSALPLVAGAPLPPLWHFVTHVESVGLEGLGRDGHPKRGGFLPPVALPRRMWAGGRFTFHRPLHLGETVAKTSTVTNVEMKQGRSGALCFVSVSHELAVDGTICIAEEQDLVYRPEPDPDAPAPKAKPAPVTADFTKVITPSEVLLFRYSALTFNSHRIHYDRRYARDVEGYPDLVFHGPLTATLLAELAVGATGRPLASFSFRGLAPLFVSEPFVIAGRQSGDTVDLWAATPDGGLAMQASAVLSDSSLM